MTILEVPFHYDIQYIPPGGRKPRHGIVYELLPLQVPDSSSSEVEETNLRIRTMVAACDFLRDMPREPLDITYYRDNEGTLLSPWHGNTPADWKPKFMHLQTFGLEGVLGEFERVTRVRGRGDLANNDLTPGIRTYINDRNCNTFTRNRDLAVREVVSSSREASLAAVRAYWTKVRFIDGILYGPTNGPAWIYMAGSAYLIDNSAAQPQGRSWIVPPEDYERVEYIRRTLVEMHPNQFPNPLETFGEIVSFDDTLELPSAAALQAECMMKTMAFSYGQRDVNSMSVAELSACANLKACIDALVDAGDDVSVDLLEPVPAAIDTLVAAADNDCMSDQCALWYREFGNSVRDLIEHKHDVAPTTFTPRI